MKYSSSIKIQALSLLIVFLSNTVMGFACSLGIDMGYNSNHHHNQTNSSELNSDNKLGDCHTEYFGDKGSSNLKDDEGSDSSNDQDCCSNEVVKFLKLDKNVSPSTTVDSSVPVLLMAVQFTYQIELLQYLKNNSPKAHHFVQSDHPPIPDIRIAIQSFLI